MKEAVIGCLVVQHLISTNGVGGRRFCLCMCVCLTGQPGHKHYPVYCGNMDTQTDKREGSESQRVLSLGPGWSNLVRQTINVKRDGSRLKLSGRALVRTAGVSTFLCPVHLTWGVIRACRRGES